MNVKIYDKIDNKKCAYHPNSGTLSLYCEENDLQYYIIGEELNSKNTTNSYKRFLAIYLSKNKFNENCKKLLKNNFGTYYLYLFPEVKPIIEEINANKTLDFTYYDTIELDDIDSGYKTQVHIYKLEKEPNESTL